MLLGDVRLVSDIDLKLFLLSIVMISGRNAVEFFMRSGLPRPVLKHIWQLCDPNLVGSLDFAGFCGALRLITLAQCYGQQALSLQGIGQTWSQVLPIPNLSMSGSPNNRAHGELQRGALSDRANVSSEFTAQANSPRGQVQMRSGIGPSSPVMTAQQPSPDVQSAASTLHTPVPSGMPSPGPTRVTANTHHAQSVAASLSIGSHLRAETAMQRDTEDDDFGEYSGAGGVTTNDWPDSTPSTAASGVEADTVYHRSPNNNVTTHGSQMAIHAPTGPMVERSAEYRQKLSAFDELVEPVPDAELQVLQLPLPQRTPQQVRHMTHTSLI